MCDAVGARETGRVQATSLGTLVQMIANGLGITLLPATSLEVEARAGSGIALRAFEAPAPGRTIGLAWRRGSARGAEFRALGEILSRCAPSLERWRGAASGAARGDAARTSSRRSVSNATRGRGRPRRRETGRAR